MTIARIEGEQAAPPLSVRARCGHHPGECAIAGEDRAFVWAEARIDGDTVVVSSPQVAKPVAARYAWANRVVIAELVRKELLACAGSDNSALIADVPHNVVLTEGGMNIHRKGATPAHDGQWALIPGSMGDHSYLALGLGNEAWLRSCSHGAGRSVRRQEMRRHARVGGLQPDTWECVTLRDERRIEEAPGAYKPIGPVIDAQVEKGLIAPVVRFRPMLTFKA